jgi:hypothetical protein
MQEVCYLTKSVAQESEDLSPHLQQLVAGHYPEPDESNPQPPNQYP